MSIFDNKYPYTDFHELNLDWIIETVQDAKTQLLTLEDRVKKASKEYIDEKLVEELEKYEEKLREFENEVNSRLSSQDAYIQEFRTEILNQLDLINRDIEDFKTGIISDFTLLTDRVNALYIYVDRKNTELEDRLHEYIASQLIDIKVLNYFTGAKVTIQEMFDTLAMLHIVNGITYEEIGEDYPTITYDNVVEYCATNFINYSNFVINARTILDSL